MTTPLTGTEASAATEASGWRFLVNQLVAAVPVTSLPEAAEVAGAAVAACGPDADTHLRVELRADRVELALHDHALGRTTTRDVELVEAINAAIDRPLLPATGVARPVQGLEIAIDALDIPRVRAFWAAALGYDSPNPDDLYDPAGIGPTFWFQQMDAPREQRNRIHFDVSVSHEEADARIAAALAAGGELVSDDEARAFWILADPEGNEVCICTWQDRD
jgi:4a-hydroxytetrahydrobiopterin dehydratase